MLANRSGILVDGPLGHTDLTRWRLDSTDHGRHIWSYQPADNDDSLSVYAAQQCEYGILYLGQLTNSFPMLPNVFIDGAPYFIVQRSSESTDQVSAKKR